MAIYLGTSNKKLLLRVNNKTTKIEMYPITNYRLLSSDNYILKDSNGIYLIPREEKYSLLLSSDDYILKSADDFYLLALEGGGKN